MHSHLLYSGNACKIVIYVKINFLGHKSTVDFFTVKIEDAEIYITIQNVTLKNLDREKFSTVKDLYIAKVLYR